jgi:hypothetical protein
MRRLRGQKAVIASLCLGVISVHSVRGQSRIERKNLVLPDFDARDSTSLLEEAKAMVERRSLAEAAVIGKIESTAVTGLKRSPRGLRKLAMPSGPATAESAAALIKISHQPWRSASRAAEVIIAGFGCWR